MQHTPNEPQAPHDEYTRGYAPQQFPPSASPEKQEDFQYQNDSPVMQQQYEYQPPLSVRLRAEAGPHERISMGIKARTAGVLCYLFSWVGGLVFLFLERENRFVRFHAAQSLLFFGSLTILTWICHFFPYMFFGIGGILGVISFIGWIGLMVAAHRGKYYKLPLLGDYAEKLADMIKL